MEDKLYYYKAIVQSVYDSDTITVDIDLGLSAWIRGEKIRFHRINAPELKGDERDDGLKARDFLRSKIDEKEIWIQTIKDKKGKYGRYLGEIWLQVEQNQWINVNDLLVEKGLAEYKDY